MATQSKFSFTIEVEGQEKPPKKMVYDLKLPKKLETMGEDEMCEWCEAQLRSGRDVFGAPFAPKADGSPATLIKTGAMVEGIVSSDWIPKWMVGRDTIGLLGITNNEPTYPWVLNAGVNPGKYKSDRIYKLNKRIQKKLDRKRRKLEEIAGTSELTMKWENLMETVNGIDKDVEELRRQIAEIEAKKVIGLPPRPWWGLMEDKREKIYRALREWLSTLIDGVVANACNPEEHSIQEADEAAQNAFENELEG